MKLEQLILAIWILCSPFGVAAAQSGAEVEQNPIAANELNLQIQERMALIEQFGGLFIPAAGSVYLAQGEVEAGSILLSVPVQHRLVGTLQNDVRRTGLVNSDKIVAPKGSPVFGIVFENATTLYSRKISSELWPSWCGFTKQTAESKPKGFCLFRDGEPKLGVPDYGESAYFPRKLLGGAGTPAEQAIVTPGYSGDQSFPDMHLAWTVRKWTDKWANVAVSVRVEERDIRLTSINLARAPDGSAMLPNDKGPIKLYPTQDNKSSVVEVLQKPTLIPAGVLDSDIRDILQSRELP